MKKTIYVAIILFLFTAASLYGQVRPGTSMINITGEQKKIKVSKNNKTTGSLHNLTSRDFTAEVYEKILDIHRLVTSCTESTSGTAKCGFVTTMDCHVEYCDEEICKNKILCCHEIFESQFNLMTMNQYAYYGEFNKTDFRYVVSGANCHSERIRCRIDTDSFYIERVVDNGSSAGYNEAYYSVILMQAIDKYKTIRYVRVFNGITIDGTNTQIIPLLIKYTDGTEKYYDLSNEIP